MVPSDYLNKVKTELDDANGVTFTDSEVYQALSEAYYITLLLGKGVIKEISVDFPTTPYWDVATSIQDYFAPVLLYNPNTKMLLYPITNKEMESLDPDWDTKTGNTTHFTTFGLSHIGLYPHYSSTPASQLLVIYQAVPGSFQSETTVNLHDSFYHLLVNHSTARLLESIFEFSKATLYWREYAEGFKEYFRFNSNRIRADFLRRVRGNAVGY